MPKDVRDAFSSRRAEVLAAAAQMHAQGPRARDTATLMTRAQKEAIEDRAALTQQWQDTAEKLGFDPAMVIARANARSAKDLGKVPGLGSTVRKVVEQGKQIAHDFAERLGIAKGDPLIPSRLGNRSPEEVAAIHGVASAIRHLGEREAAFSKVEIYRTALGFALPAAFADIERRTLQLIRQGHLQAGKGPDRDMLTTHVAISLEQRILAGIEAGRGVAPAIVP